MSTVAAISCLDIVTVDPMPSLRDVPYGAHERQVLDFWRPQTDRPAPVVLFIHGGGWTGNDKSHIELPGGVQRFLAADIAVVSINYRYLVQTPVTDIQLRVKPPLDDAARALQFVRSKASEWNIDANRIAASGASAGGLSALWLAFSADRANRRSSDTVERESSRPNYVAVRNAQTTLDPQQMRRWTPNSRYGGHAFGFAWVSSSPEAEFEEFYQNRDKVLHWTARYSPIELAHRGAPPVYLYYDLDAPEIGTEKPDPTHTANFGLKLHERLLDLGVESEFVYPGAPQVIHANVDSYVIDRLNR